MRDDTKSWAPSGSLGDVLTVDGVRIERVRVLRQTLVSGPLALNTFDDTSGPSVGWPDIAEGPSYAVALRRDRLLLVNGPELADGWDETAQLAVSDMTGGYAVFELSGERAFHVLRRGADVHITEPSRSSVRMFGGFAVVLYRYQDQCHFRLHISAAQEEAVVLLLRHYMQTLDR